MEDLTAASAEDVLEFFRKYYSPQNASLVIAGDITPAEARKKVESWFADVKPGKSADPIEVPPVMLPGVVKETLTDDVQLPRLSLVWPTPAVYAPGDAELDVVAGVLTGGKNSRLYKRLVYELQVAQSVVAYQSSAMLGSQFRIDVTARPSKEPPAQVLEKLKGSWTRNSQSCARRRRPIEKSSGSSTRPRRLSTREWSVSAVSAAKPIS